MKRISAVLLAVPAVIVLASCSFHNGGNTMSGNSGKDLESIFQTVCSADDALELAGKSDLPVFERQGCTSGKDAWDKFYETVSKGTPAAVLCADYYTLDSEHMSAELYEEEKDKYPKLFFSLVEYDGTVYSVKVRESSVEALDYQQSFRYLLHFSGDAPATARYSGYDNYVLVDDPSATWESIMAAMVSSQSSAAIRHHTVYRDYIGWNGD